MSRYFEDYATGEVHRTRQPHLHARRDRGVRAPVRHSTLPPFRRGRRRTLFKGLCASGWHTSAVWLRLLVDHRKREADLMRWRGERPAIVGPSPAARRSVGCSPSTSATTIRYVSRVTDLVPSKSRPTVGLLVTENEGSTRRARSSSRSSARCSSSAGRGRRRLPERMGA